MKKYNSRGKKLVDLSEIPGYVLEVGLFAVFSVFLIQIRVGYFIVRNPILQLFSIAGYIVLLYTLSFIIQMKLKRKNQINE